MLPFRRILVVGLAPGALRALPMGKNSPGGQGTPSHSFHPPVSNSAWHTVGTLQISGEEERGVKEGGTS